VVPNYKYVYLPGHPQFPFWDCTARAYLAIPHVRLDVRFQTCCPINRCDADRISDIRRPFSGEEKKRRGPRVVGKLPPKSFFFTQAAGKLIALHYILDVRSIHVHFVYTLEPLISSRRGEANRNRQQHKVILWGGAGRRRKEEVEPITLCAAVLHILVMHIRTGASRQ
jgi:hypothetical protein